MGNSETFNIITNIIAKATGLDKIKQISQTIKDGMSVKQKAVKAGAGAAAKEIEFAQKTNKAQSDAVANSIKNSREEIAGKKKVLAVNKTLRAQYKQQGFAQDEVNKIMKKQTAGQRSLAASTIALSNKNKEIRDVMDRTGRSANKANEGIRTMGNVFNKAGRPVDALGNKMKNDRKSMDALKKSTVRFKMANLGLMFGFMALQRVVGGFWKSALASYNKANEETSAFRKETNKLSAAWEFFKYTMINALSTSVLFKLLIVGVMSVINWFNKLSPVSKRVIAIGLAILFVVSTIGFIIASIALFVGSLAGVSSATWAATAGIILALIGVGLVIWGITGIVDNWGKDWVAVTKYIGVALLGLALIIGSIAIVIGSVALVWVAVAVAVVAIIAILIAYIIKSWTKIKIFMVKMLAGFVIGFLKFQKFVINVFRTIINFIINSLVYLIKKIIDIWAWMIKMIIDGIFMLPKVFVKVFQFIIDGAISFVESLLSVFKKIPGIGGIIDSSISGLRGISSNVFNSLTKGLNGANKAATGLVDSISDLGKGTISFVGGLATGAVNKMADKSVSAADKMIDGMNKWKDSSITAIKKVAAVKKAADDAAKAQSIKTDAATSSTTGFMGMLSGSQKKIQFLSGTTTSDSKIQNQVINDNSTTNITIPNATNMDDIIAQADELKNNRLNEGIGSGN